MLEENYPRAHVHRAIIILPHSREHFVHDKSMDVAQLPYMADLSSATEKPSSLAFSVRNASLAGLTTSFDFGREGSEGF